MIIKEVLKLQKCYLFGNIWQLVLKEIVKEIVNILLPGNQYNTDQSDRDHVKDIWEYFWQITMLFLFVSLLDSQYCGKNGMDL